MDPSAQLAYELPALYRRILDAVAELERAGRRDLAAELRRRAVATYSRSWDARAHRRLTEILERCNRAIVDAHVPRGHRLLPTGGSAQDTRSHAAADESVLGGVAG